MAMTTERVKEVAGVLRFWATHFDYSDWEYTRDTGDMKYIRYRRDYTGYHRVDRRLCRAVKHAFLWKMANWEKTLLNAESFWARQKIRFSWTHVWSALKVWSRKDKNMPDGVLDRGNVIVMWEETGDYLNMVSPAVGALLADWMDAEPESEYAVRIAELMNKPPSYAVQHD